MGLTGLKSRGCVPLRRLKKLCSGLWSPLASPTRHSTLISCSVAIFPSLTLTTCLSLIRTFVVTLGRLDTLESFSHLKILNSITPAKFLLPQSGHTFLPALVVRTWTSLGGDHAAYRRWYKCEEKVASEQRPGGGALQKRKQSTGTLEAGLRLCVWGITQEASIPGAEVWGEVGEEIVQEKREE